jgi:hypothetical protein
MLTNMATVKKGLLTSTGEWWKHLRSTKRAFWKGERQAAKAAASREARDTAPPRAERAPDRERL